MCRLFNLTLLVVLIAISRCSIGELTGGGSDLPDKKVVQGKIFAADHLPAVNAQVTIVPADYNAVTDSSVAASSIDTTDATGNFSIVLDEAGEFNVQAVDLSRGDRLLAAGISVGREDTVTLDGDTLRPPGCIKVVLPGDINFANGYIYLPGTTIAARPAGAAGYIVIDSIPAGIIPAVCYSRNNDTVPVAVRYAVAVYAGDTAVAAKPAWNFSRRIILNTSLSGANVAGNVEHFPVLVKLTNNNFDFSQAKGDGADLRFTMGDTAALPYEIERWDAAGQHAEIWVNVDTVRGNDSTQFITMYWGNSSAGGLSNGGAVFDTATGFKGVWHLGESAGTIDDATKNGFKGTKNGNQAAVPGKIGFGQAYDGSGDFSDMGNVCNPAAAGFSVCAWVKLSAAKQYQAIIAKSRGDDPSSSYGWLVEIGADGALTVFIATDTGTWGGARTFVLASRVFITDTVAWHHVAAVIDRAGNSSCKLYIDGAMITAFSVGGDIGDVGTVVNSVPLRLGSDAKGGCPLNGSLDECSLAFVPRSADWVRLCYMNQKEDNRLIRFANGLNR